MMSTIQTFDPPKASDEVHSAILEGAKFMRTPTYDFAIKRLLTLGLTMEEAKEILKDQNVRNNL